MIVYKTNLLVYLLLFLFLTINMMGNAIRGTKIKTEINMAEDVITSATVTGAFHDLLNNMIKKERTKAKVAT